MSNAYFSLEGNDELIAAIQNISGEDCQDIIESVNEAGNYLKGKIDGNAKGNLKDALEYKEAKKNQSSVDGAIVAKKGFAYITPYEYGHGLVAWGHKTDKYITGRPNVRNTTDNESNNTLDRIETGIDKLIEKFGG